MLASHISLRQAQLLTVCFIDRASQYISTVTDRASQYISTVTDRASQYISVRV
jgi:hypothetical protein